MEKLISEGKTYNYYEFPKESDFEEKIVEFSKEIFGKDTIYFNVKMKLKNGKIASIPDGFLIDFTFENSPRFCIVENELSNHDIFSHISPQVIKFNVSYKNSYYKIKEFLLKEIENDDEKSNLINEKIKKSKYRNIDACLDDIISRQELTCIIVIDQNSDDLENVCKYLPTKTDIIEFQAFKNEQNFIYKFTPFQEEVRELEEIASKVKIDELDTVIVAARQEGFNQVFLGEDCWYSIRISSSILPKIKYIGAYETAPVSAINYYAKVDRIEKYENTNKYILYFKDKAIKLDHPIKLGKNSALAPQAPRYTNIDKLLNAKTLEDVFQ